MTKTNNKNSRQKSPFYRRPWVIILLVLILITALAAIYLFVTKQSEPESKPASRPEEANTSTITPMSNDSPDDHSEISSPEPEDKVTQYEGKNPNTLSELTGSVTYRGVHDGVLIVTTMINQYLTSEGTCKLTLIDASGVQSYSTTNPAIADISTSYCQNFNIPTATLKPGKYQINIIISSDQKTGIITDEVEL